MKNEKKNAEDKEMKMEMGRNRHENEVKKKYNMYGKTKLTSQTVAY